MASNLRVWRIIPLLLIVVFFCPFAYGKIIYVNDDGQADFDNIQAAIDDANDGDTILVAPGIYTGEGNRDIDFKGKAIKVRSTDPNNLEIVKETIINCQGSEEYPHRGFQFVSDENRDSVLSGFKIINGFGPMIIQLSGYRESLGGAILCMHSSPTIFNCVIERNFTIHLGGGAGIYCLNSNAAITKCTIQYNNAKYGGGGGILCHAGSVDINQCILSSNIASYGGGVSFDGRSDSSIRNCLISSNLAQDRGGGIYCSSMYADITINSCTIVRNVASETSRTAGGVSTASLRSSPEQPIKLTNCILWDNRRGYECNLNTQIDIDPAVSILSHCCVQDWIHDLAGEGNFGDDPLLTPDFHLKADSPCINTGILNDSVTQSGVDIDGESRDLGGYADVGCDEYIDLDNDSIPDFWERQHFETTINVEADQDPDEDKFTNIQEYNRCSNPNYPPVTFYVNALSGDDYWDGLSAAWDGQHGPKATIQAAIDQASFYEKDSIIVAPGTYAGVGNRDIDFKGKVITVKSEHGQDTCFIDCQGTEEDPHRGFYFHSGEGANSVVQGFTIINGFTGEGGAIFCGSSSPTICDCTIRSNTTKHSPDYDGNGGGIYCNSSKALIKDCKIIENTAIPVMLIVAIGGKSGGIYCTNSDLTITGCEISNNISSKHRSGAVCSWMSDITINNCKFNNNQDNGVYIYTGNLNITGSSIANNRIDGINSYSSNLKITDCIITDNQDSGVNSSSSNEVIIKNCDISKNRSQGLRCSSDNNILIEQCLIIANRRRGISCYAVDRLTINNCTIAHNRIAGISCDDGSTNCSIRNSIIWENPIELDKRLFDNPLCSISYCNIQGALESVEITGDYPINWGQGNVNLDPNFVNPGYWDIRGAPDSPFNPGDDIWIDGDYHLKSQAGRWNPASESWVVDDVTSPCIDAGDPNNPVGREPFPNGSIINMGAYGGTPQASKSYILAKIIYVDDDAVGLNDGSSWQNAYAFLQDALYDAETSEKPVEIRVAQGIYKPNQRMPQTPGHGDNTFTLVNEVTVKGGYAGFSKPDPNNRDIETCETILSGDLNSDDIVVDDPCEMLLIESNRGDNSHVVVRANHTDATAVLDGFVITGGFFKNMYTGPSNGGAGMHIYQGSPTIRNCKFTGNTATQIGGGLLNRGDSHPMLINCEFRGNYAESGGAIYNKPNMPAPGMISEGSHPTLVNCTFDNNCAFKNGGGIYNFLSNPTLTNCIFRHNKVIGPYSGSTRGPQSGGGGGVYNSNSSPVLTNCTFSENSADIGGGIYNYNGSPIIVNCTIELNSARWEGGGMSCLDNSNPTLTNCTFALNYSSGGGGMYNSNSNPKLTNCVFTENFSVESNIIIEPIPSAGGGIYNYRSNTLLIDCTFIGNSASHGGGIFNYKSNSIITNCTFTANRGDYGGGITSIECSPTLINCILTGNGTCYSYGGGMYGGSPTLINCTISGNRAQECGGICYSIPNMVNCIVWSNSSPQIISRASISYSNIQDGWLGESNIDADPCFVNPGYWADANYPNVVIEPNDPNAVWIDGDYHLKSQAGRWDPVSESWVVDDVTSPCIDAGDPNSPIGHEPLPNGGRINMGAYGGTEQASLSLSTGHTIRGDSAIRHLSGGSLRAQNRSNGIIPLLEEKY